MENKNINKEHELYEPMRKWLHSYLTDKYSSYKITTIDAHAERLDKVLSKIGIFNNLAIGLNIQIDILGIAQKNSIAKLFFIEAKKTQLTLRDLGQLWAYCKLIDPEEAFLMSSAGLGSLNKLLKTYHREDLLDFGNGKINKKMKISIWDVGSNSPDLATMIPKI